MKTKILIIIFLVGLISCKNKQVNKIQRDGEPTIYTVEENDVEMNEAIEKAKQSLDIFKAALLSNDKDYEYFALKMRFKTPDGGEHIWLNNIKFKDNQYFGIVNNFPESTTEVEIGDTIQIRMDDISDWMYLDKNKLCGGYTIRVLRDRMTVEERQDFDKENDMIIEDEKMY